MESQYKIGISDIHDYALVKGQKNYDFGVKNVGLYMHLNVSLDQLKIFAGECLLTLATFVLQKHYSKGHHILYAISNKKFADKNFHQ